MERARASSFPVVLWPAEEGGFTVQCPVLPGCISEGDTREEALANIREAIELCLESAADEGWEVPSTYEVVDVRVPA